MRQFFATFLAGDAPIGQCFMAMATLLVSWTILAALILESLGTVIAIRPFVLLVNGAVFIWGGLAIYGASITSHAISASFIGSLPKFFARFMNFILLFAGIVMIILTTSGELSWIVYLSQGVGSAIR